MTSLQKALFSRRQRQSLIGAVYILPSFVLMFIFNVSPIFLSIFYSFTKYDMTAAPIWVGFENYIKLSQNKYLGTVLTNTV